MHICFISHEYPLWATGGIGSFIQTLGREIFKKGHQVTVLGIGVGAKEEVITDQGVKLIRLPAPKYFRKGSFIENAYRIRRKIKQIHKENPIDVVETPEWGLAFLPKKTAYVKLIRMHGGHHFFAKSENRNVNKWKAWQEIRSFNNADYLVAVSGFVGSETSRLLNLKKKFRVIYNFVDFKKFNIVDNPGVNKGELLFLGTICEKKGVGKLIESFPYIIQQHPHVRLKLVGRDLVSKYTGESYTAKMKASIPVNLIPFIEFTGPVPHNQVPDYIRKSEIVVLPSFMEAMPIAWLEVLAMGKPLVASQEGPGPEAVQDGVTGLLCNPYDAKDIAMKVNHFLEHPTQAVETGQRAHKFAFENFNVDKLVADNIEFYKSIIVNRVS